MPINRLVNERKILTVPRTLVREIADYRGTLAGPGRAAPPESETIRRPVRIGLETVNQKETDMSSTTLAL